MKEEWLKKIAKLETTNEEQLRTIEDDMKAYRDVHSCPQDGLYVRTHLPKFYLYIYEI